MVTRAVQLNIIKVYDFLTAGRHTQSPVMCQVNGPAYHHHLHTLLSGVWTQSHESLHNLTPTD